jgi:hypothetical protein
MMSLDKSEYDELEDAVKNLVAEAKRLRSALVYVASLLNSRIEGDDIPSIHIRDYALDVLDMTVAEALAVTEW